MATAQLGTVIRHIRRLAAASATQNLADIQLLERFADKHDEAAFAELVRRHGRLVWNACRHVLHHDEDAEDAFQATFLALALKATSLRKLGALAGWLHGAAFRSAMQIKRQAARRRFHEQQAVPMPQQKVHSELAWRELQAVLDEEVQRLPEKHRAPFVLCCLEGKTKAEAAKDLGWKEGTVSGRLAEARKHLQRRLAHRGVSLSAVLCAGVLSQAAAGSAVPATLIAATVRGALQIAAGGAAVSAVVSAKVAGAVHSVTKTALMTQCKVATALLLAVTAVTSAGVLTHRALARKNPAAQGPAVAQPAAKTEQPNPEPIKQARTDHYGDPLPPGAIARLGTIRLRHGFTVQQISLSRDGKTLATACRNYNFYLWDVATGRVKRREHRGAGLAIAFSSDGKTFASGGHGEVLVWDSATGRELRRSEVKAENVTYLTFAPDDKTLACLGEDNTVHLLELASGKQRHQWQGPPNYLASSVAFSPDANILAIAHKKDSVVRLYDTATGAELHHFPSHKPYIFDVAFSPDGKMLISSFGDTLYFYEVTTGKEVRQVKPGGWVKTLLFSPDGKTLVLGGFDVRLWDVITGKTVRRFTWDRGVGSVNCVALSGNGKTLAASLEGNEHTVAVWDVASGKRLHAFEGHLGGIHTVAFSPDGRLLATGASERNHTPDNRVRLWDPATGKPLGQLGKGLGLVYSIAFSPDGKFLAASNEDGTIRFLDPDTGKELRALAGHRGLITSIAFSADGKTLASRAYDRTIRIWDVASGKERNCFPGNRDPHVSIALSADGKVVAEGDYGDRTVRLWEAATGKELRRVPGFQSGSLSGAFSPDGKLLAAGGQHGAGDELRLLETATGKEVQRFPGDQQGTRLVVFSPDGRSLAAVSADSVIHLWEVATGKLRGRFYGYGELFLSVAFSPDGRFLAVGSQEATAYVFDVMWLGRGGRPQKEFPSHKDLQALWADLAHEDAAKAFSAISALAAAAREAVPFLKEYLRPVPPLEEAQRKRISQWIEDLGSDQFAVRQTATRQLEKLGEPAYPAMRTALEGKPPLETRRRLDRLLQRVEGWSPERLRSRRSLEVLEYIGTPAARELLQALAQGAPEARLTQEARAALERLGSRNARE